MPKENGMKKVTYIGHQGDVAIFRVSEFPKGTKTQDELTKNCQLALGELSGHNHYMDNANAVDMFKVVEFPGITCVDVKEDVKMVHGLIKGFKGIEPDKEYHNEIQFYKGDKIITGIVEETDWLTKTVRRVVD